MKNIVISQNGGGKSNTVGIPPNTDERSTLDAQLQVGDVVVVDALKGYDTGVVSVCGELAKIQVAKKRKPLGRG